MNCRSQSGSGKCKHRKGVEAELAVIATAAPGVRATDGDTLGDELADALSRSFSLGMDAHGKTHHYFRPADTVVAFDGDGVEHRQCLAGRSLAEWVEFVEQDRGWASTGPLTYLAERVDATREEGGR